MIFPRLILARNLLRQDGLFFASIDDNELENLRKVCNEVFGESNFIAQVMIVANPGGRDYNQVAVTHEYLLIYQKSSEAELLEIEKEMKFKFADSLGGFEFRELRNRNPRFHSGNRPNLFYPFWVNPDNCDENGYCAVSLDESNEYAIEVKPYNSAGAESVWRWGKQKASENIVFDDLDLSQILAKQKKDGNWNIYEKNRKSTTKVKSIWDETEMRTENGTRLVRELFGSTVFDHPKPIALIERIAQISGDSGIYLDFFSGSASTAHAVMNQNSKDNGTRSFIMVQLPEQLGQKSEGKALGFNTISELARRRIVLASEKILNEGGRQDLDCGYRSFKLDSSNLQAWSGDPDMLNEDLFSSTSNIKDDRTTADILIEILLKYGIDLNVPIEKQEVDGHEMYSIGWGAIFVCVSKRIEVSIASSIGEWKSELKPEVCRVVLRDSGMTDVSKTNIYQTLKRFGISEIRSI